MKSILNCTFRLLRFRSLRLDSIPSVKKGRRSASGSRPSTDKPHPEPTNATQITPGCETVNSETLFIPKDPGEIELVDSHAWRSTK